VVVDVYDRRGIVREVDGLGTVDEVSQRIMTALS
jgi:adenylate kinase